MSELPNGWAACRVGAFSKPTRSIDPSKFHDEIFDLYSVPSYSTGAPEVVAGEAVKSNKQVVEPGDVLLCKIVPHINRVWVVSPSRGRRQIASGEWIVYRSESIDPYYLRHLLSAPDFRTPFLDTVSGVGGSLMRARPALVQSIEIVVAPAPEQRRIVEKLDSVRTRSSRARQELDHIPKLIERNKQAILAKAVSGELTADWRRTHGASQWKQGNAGMYFKWASGKFLPKSKQSLGQIPVYGGNGPNGLHDTALIADPTLVIGRVGAHCGNVHLTSGPAWVTDNAIYASEIAATVDAKFALLLFRNANLNADAGGSGQPFVNQTILNETDFPVPDLAEQQEIVRLVHTALTWLDKIATDHARANHLLPKLDQAILAKAFRGELVPQDPNDEPASELLQRITKDVRGGASRKRK